MKMTRSILLLGGVPFLATAIEIRALPPRQHAVSGVISRIDCDAHTITLTAAR